MRKAKKLLAILITAILCFGLLPTAAFAADIQAGKPAFTVNTSDATVVGFGGKQWAAVGYDGVNNTTPSDTLTLLLANGQSYGNTQFSTSDNTYSGSILQTAMDNAYSGLPSKEQCLVLGHDLPGGGNNGDPGNVKGGTVSDARFWPLNETEVKAVNSSLRPFGYHWWLRSPGLDTYTSSATLVISSGSVNRLGGDVDSEYAIRPAFKLNLSSVLFTSAASAESGKSSETTDSDLAPATTPSGAIKFTMKDDSLNLDSTVSTVGTVQAGETVSMDYSNATTGASNYVSCVIANSDGRVLFYGKLAQGTASGTANFTVPTETNLPDGNYTVKLFAEEANADNATDFCSEPVNISMTVDNNGPVLSNETANRNSDTNASVTFTSNETGTYYYQLDGTEPTAAELVGNASAINVNMDSGENTIQLSGLTAGVHKIYIAAKDTGDNVSNLLTISILAYIPPPTYNVTLNQATGGTATATPSSGTAGTAITLNTTLEPNYSFVRWEVSPVVTFTSGGATSQNAVFAMPSGGVTVMPVYQYNPPTHTLTVINGMDNTNTGPYTAGAQVSITADPAPARQVFDCWTGGNGGSFENANSATTIFTMPGNAATVTATYKPDGSVLTDGSISPSSITFDKNTASANYKDVAVTLSPGDYTLSAVKNGGYILQAGTDYTVSGSAYTIKEEYLATLNAGEQAITFDMSGGADPALTVTVTDTTPIIYTVNTHFGTWTGSGTATARADADRSKFVRLLNGNAEVGTANYTVTEGSTVITLHESYLETLINGTYTFRAEFTDGYADMTLQVDVQANPADDVPQTGDNGNMMGWLLMLLSSVLVILWVCVWRKWRQVKGTW